ncbi:hypothetical protein EUGRSUZ_B02311 [Eucalyptus grandis]|uniref:LTI65/LTI78 PGEED repeat domain-containing protein n=2 Tax=Eucalyptus grandis TaxID=71139 RepID=A0A059D455_EUCGR|nr:hypothetical protein EUGRSUZ_B02311 [Eucalyptus grandis]
MAQRFDGRLRYSKSSTPSPRTPTTPTVEQLLYDGPGESSRWSSTSPTFMRGHDLEDDHLHSYPNNKKSVLAKVKERARRWHLSLGKKRNANDGNTTPLWGVSLDEDDAEEDAEYLGAPMYESELAPEDCKEKARQHPRANPVISEKHLLPNSIDHETEAGKGNPLSPDKTMTETMTEKLTPAYTMVSDATQAITSKIQNAPAYATDATYTIASKIQNVPGYATDATHAVASKIQNLTVSSPAAGSAAGRPANIAVRGHLRDTPAERKLDKGVSVKEYIMHKFEPGEDDRALSQVITEAISPRKGPADGGVVEKVREAVSNLLRNQEASSTTAFHSATNSSTHIPASTNAHEAMEEENYGRILQAN